MGKVEVVHARMVVIVVYGRLKVVDIFGPVIIDLISLVITKEILVDHLVKNIITLTLEKRVCLLYGGLFSSLFLIYRIRIDN